jgi:hypothetical protein
MMPVNIGLLIGVRETATVYRVKSNVYHLRFVNFVMSRLMTGSTVSFAYPVFGTGLDVSRKRDS